MTVLEKLGEETKEVLKVNVKKAAESSSHDIVKINSFYQLAYLGYLGNTHEMDCEDTSGVLYIINVEDLSMAETLIKEFDEFEYGYMPKGFIQVWDSPICPLTVGTKKFELDLSEVLKLLWAKGIESFYLLEKE